ncbi:hypothetical protein NC653_019021 [Populus alba x Populus x berolinensis]|uniref:Uncharacterized protein n=1 Tax=Populus alba x Populus x berolinensis TaxID=444605 RepID=A0AAD6QHS2_9ROSI|nr:hypothetical protein NC653_019021 [Populus alba x Populus x berolinensis]
MKALLGLSLTGVFGGVAVKAATESSATTRKLDQTPTWAWFTEKHKQALFEALEKVKAVGMLLGNSEFGMIIAELMILGFISLLLTFGQNHIAKICVPQDVSRHHVAL